MGPVPTFELSDIDAVLGKSGKIRARGCDADGARETAGNVRAQTSSWSARGGFVSRAPDAIEKEIVAFFSKKGEAWSSILMAFALGRAFPCMKTWCTVRL
jgi:hypothetical protein